MRILFCGDLVGRSGRDVVIERLPALRRDLGLDLVVVNGENAAGGFGISQKICEELYKAGADCITTGNHVWDQKETISFIGSDPRLLRPINFPAGTPGKGSAIYQTARGKKVLVANIMARLFMDPLDDPFQAADQLLKAHRLPSPRGGGNIDAILIDFHGEATSEKMAMGHFLDGKVSLVVGRTPHVPTADHMILAKGTAYQTDAGMCGDYDSVIGMEKAIPVATLHQENADRTVVGGLGARDAVRDLRRDRRRDRIGEARRAGARRRQALASAAEGDFGRRLDDRSHPATRSRDPRLGCCTIEKAWIPAPSAGMTEPEMVCEAIAFNRSVANSDWRKSAYAAWRPLGDREEAVDLALHDAGALQDLVRDLGHILGCAVDARGGDGHGGVDAVDRGLADHARNHVGHALDLGAQVGRFRVSPAE